MPGGAGDGGADEASAILGTDVTEDRSGWWVEMTVGFEGPDGVEVVRRRIGPYLTEDRARMAAHFIPRAAGRESLPPDGT